MEHRGDRGGGESAEPAGGQQRELRVELGRDRARQVRHRIGHDRDALGSAYVTERPSEARSSSDERRGFLATHQAGQGSDARAGAASAVAGAAHDPRVGGGEVQAERARAYGEHARFASGRVADGHGDHAARWASRRCGSTIDVNRAAR
jgi:hypothetical protein